MKRLLVIVGLVGALALPAEAALGGPHALRADGTLSVQGLTGVIDVRGFGAVLGTVGQGRIQIAAPAGTARVAGATRQRGEASIGANMSFRILGSSAPGSQGYHLRITGIGVDLSITGRALVSVVGAGTADDGSYSLNGDAVQAVTNSIATIAVTGAAPAPVAGPRGSGKNGGAQAGTSGGGGQGAGGQGSGALVQQSGVGR